MNVWLHVYLPLLPSEAVEIVAKYPNRHRRDPGSERRRTRSSSSHLSTGSCTRRCCPTCRASASRPPTRCCWPTTATRRSWGRRWRKMLLMSNMRTDRPHPVERVGRRRRCPLRVQVRDRWSSRPTTKSGAVDALDSRAGAMDTASAEQVIRATVKNIGKPGEDRRAAAEHDHAAAQRARESREPGWTWSSGHAGGFRARRSRRTVRTRATRTRRESRRPARCWQVRDRRCDGGGDSFRRIRSSGAAVLIRGLVDVEEVERLVGDGEADLAVLVVEVRLADR